MDRISVLPFNGDMLAKLISQSHPIPLVYKVVGIFITSNEKEIASQIGNRKTIELY